MIFKILKTLLFQICKDFHAGIARKLNINHKPWMRHKEMDLIVATIDGLKPKRSLEWGSGYSSIYFPSFIPKNASWLALEHEAEWAEKVKRLNTRKNVNIHTVGPNISSWKGEGTYQEFTDYIEYPSSEKFDLIIVDGRARGECVIKSKAILRDGGVVILHDANRKKYQHVMNIFENTAHYTDQRSGYGGIWLGSDSPLNEAVDIEFHNQLWDTQNRLNTYLSLKRYF